MQPRCEKVGYVGKTIATLHWRSRKHLESRLKEVGLSWSEFQVIAVLMRHGDGLTQKEIAAKLNITKGTASKVMKKLEDEGYIRRKRKRGDARIKLVYLTDKAMNLVNRMKKIGKEWNDTLTRGFTEAEKKQLYEYLDRMLKNTEDAK